MEAKEFHKYATWCWENGIKIFPIPLNATGTVLKIAVEKNGKIKLGEEKYTNATVYDKIKELYKLIFTKNNHQSKNEQL